MAAGAAAAAASISRVKTITFAEISPGVAILGVACLWPPPANARKGALPHHGVEVACGIVKHDGQRHATPSGPRRQACPRCRGQVFSPKKTPPRAIGAPFATHGTSFSTRPASFPTNGELFATSGALFATNGVSFETLRTSFATNGTPFATNEVSFATNEVSFATNGVAFAIGRRDRSPNGAAGFGVRRFAALSGTVLTLRVIPHRARDARLANAHVQHDWGRVREFRVVNTAPESGA